VLGRDGFMEEGSPEASFISPSKNPKYVKFCPQISRSSDKLMWNKISKTLSLVAFTAAMVAGAQTQTASAAAPSTTPPSGPAPSKVGVISIQGVIANTNEFKRDFEQLAGKYEPKKKELETLRAEVDKLKADLNTQQDKLSDAERNTRVRSLEQKQKNYERLVEDANNEFNNDQGQIVQRIGEKVMRVVDNYAKSNNYAVVVDVSTQQGPVLWAAEQVNISQQVLDAYNQQSGVPAPAANAPSATPKTPPAAPRKPATTPSTNPR